MTVQRVICTHAGVRRGIITSIPFAIGTIAWGVAFSVLATGEGFSGWQAMLMTVVVYSGTAQILAIDLMSDHASTIAIWSATLLVSVRYVLLGMSTRDWFVGLRQRWAMLGLLTMGDQSWAMANVEMTQGRRDVGYFLGLNIGFAVGWLMGTALGIVIGGVMPDPTAWGLEYAATAAFIAIVVESWRGRPDLVPWIVAAGTALAAERWIGGQWYVLIGALAGSLIGVVMTRKATPNAR